MTTLNTRIYSNLAKQTHSSNNQSRIVFKSWGEQCEE